MLKTCLSYYGENCFDENVGCIRWSYWEWIPDGYNDIFIEDNELSEIKVYPNPTNEAILQFEEEQKNINISLMDLSGKEISIKADYKNNMIEIPIHQ